MKRIPKAQRERWRQDLARIVSELDVYSPTDSADFRCVLEEARACLDDPTPPDCPIEHVAWIEVA